ncbi:MAG: hypothetical protein QW220_02970 [Candidatus Bathyarchaeia archaeon]
MSEIGELSSIFNRVVLLARALLEERGYVFSVNLDLLKRSLAIQVMEKVTESKGSSGTFPVFYTLTRPIGNSPFATTVPEEIARAMGLKPGDRISWLAIDSGAFIIKARSAEEKQRKIPEGSKKRSHARGPQS